MPRKSLWPGLLISLCTAIFICAPAKAQTKTKYRPSGPPSLSLSADTTTVRACADEARVLLTAKASSASASQLRYKWTSTSGHITGNGANTTWDLSGVRAGVYEVMLEVDDANTVDCVAFSSLSVVVTECPPPPPPPLVCPTVTVSCPEAILENATATFTATISGGSPNVTPTYDWTVSAGRIVSGQGTSQITVDTTGLEGQTVRASLQVGGFGTPCPANCSTAMPITIKPRKFDEYYDIARNDEKARLDNYAIQLQNEPGSQGYIIIYPSSRAKASEAQARATRISDYLVNSRGIDSSRFTITIAQQRQDWLFELWIVPQGARPPSPSR